MTPANELRVLVLSDAEPDRNGVGSYYRDLIQNLAPHLGAIEMVAPGGRHGKWLETPLPGDPTQRVSLPSLRRVAQHVSAFAPHAMIVPTPGPYGLFGGRLARRLGIPLAFGFHTHFEHLAELYWGPLMGRISTWYLKTTTLHLFRRSEVVLCHSETMLKAAEGLGANRSRLASTLLPPDFLAEPDAPREHLSRVLFLGRLAAEKRIDRLLEAAAKLPDIQFSFAGDGPQRDLVSREAARLTNVVYLGWQERAAIPALLADHDLLVLPSDVEAFGTVALEALACRRTPLVSERCGIRDWPQLAPMVHQFDPTADAPLAASIEAIRRLPFGERVTLADDGRRAALALNDEGVADWLSLLEELAGSRAA
ncbi:MAG: glycosyltransferase [Pseudomonadota bacterium]